MQKNHRELIKYLALHNIQTTFIRGKRHPKLILSNGKNITIPNTPSDFRFRRNVLAFVRKAVNLSVK